MRENVEHFSIDDSYIFGSSENTSTTSSGEVVLRANKPLYRIEQNEGTYNTLEISLSQRSIGTPSFKGRQWWAWCRGYNAPIPTSLPWGHSRNVQKCRQLGHAETNPLNYDCHCEFFYQTRIYIPGLSQYRYTVANLHRLQHGVATPVPVQPSARIRIDEAQLDHFLQFITSPHIFQDMPFGLKNLRLSKCNGNVLEVPNVIQCLIPERIAVQYE